MKPIEFEGHNIVYGESQPEYNPLPAHLTKGPSGDVWQCWQLSADDLEEIKITGKIWVCQLTFNKPLQPIIVTASTPDFNS